jgi:diguanylate cyclase (GGDEF)-like protein
VRITSGAGVRRWTLGTMIFVAVVSALIVATIYGARNALPTIVIAGTFQSLFASTVAPIIFAANLLAAAAILAASKRPNTLQLWLAVALATAALDGALNAYSSGRYTISWYVGKLGTLTTASIVLMVLLSELSRLYRRLSDLATIDALTGLPNRQSFDSDARFALQMYQRGAPDLAFLILDVDFFKQYNDTYGHQQGDACLRNVSASLRRTCTRSIDLVGRFGGEEFVVLLPGTDRDGALRVAEAIRSNVEALRIEHAASSIATVVTVSIGIALTSHVAIASPARDAYLEELVRGADTALYAAKQKRNTVAIAQASAVPAS